MEKSRPNIVTRALKEGWIFKSVYLDGWIFRMDEDRECLDAQELREIADELDRRNEEER